MRQLILRAAGLLLLGLGMVAGTPTASASAGLEAATASPLQTNATPAPMSMAEVADKASAESKTQQVIERLPDGRVRMTAPMQDLEALIGFDRTTLRSTDEAGAAGFHWQVQRLGRQGALSVVPWGEVAIAGEVVQVQRAALIEEFRADADGIRQDFVVASRPSGGGDLLLELSAQDAELAPVEQHEGKAVAVKLDDGRVLHYHRLHVTDATGSVLAARMEVTDAGALRIAVADRGAAYPVRIDPTFSDADWTALDVPGFNNSILAIIVAGNRVFVGGNFTASPGGSTNHVAVWNGNSWAALGSGMNSTVSSLAWDAANSRLYAGGGFSTAGGVSANSLAVWNGTSWSALGSGMDGGVSALLWDSANSRLYAGGNFSMAGGMSANSLAVWNGSSWSALGSGVNSSVRALAWDAANSRLYAGGSFTTAGGGAANRIAVWNGSSWSALGSGMNNDVTALAWDAANSRLYAGGNFTTAGGASANRTALWNGSSWSALGSGMGIFGVSALAWDAANSRLYAGGFFTTAGGVSANNIAVWNGISWSALGSGVNTDVIALAWDAANSRLYAGGGFSTAGGVSANRVAAWDGSNWSALGTGMDSFVRALAWDAANSRLYAGGIFTTAGGVSANRIAMWDGSSWTALGSGMNFNVIALAWDAANSRLYAGGDFTLAGGTAAMRIAVWNGSSWAALGSGMDSNVTALAWDAANSRLYAGGNFTTAGGVSANRIAVWNGSSWAALGSGMDSAVLALAWDAANSRLYAGGGFFTAGGASANRIAVWNGSSWTALGSGMNAQVNSLAWDAANSRLYAGGFFTTAGGVSANTVAVWNGSSWSALGSGMNFQVSALAWDAANSRLYAGGDFTTAGGASANRIAIWDGSSWSALGSGMNNTVRALAWDAGNRRLYAGGDFTTAGGMPARVAQAQFPLPQTITFANPGAQAFGTTPTLTATASSSLTVSFSSAAPGVCTITVGGTLTFLTTGTCTINADQAGDATYDPAPQVQQSFAVNAVAPAAPTIGTATAGDGQASVTFSGPGFDGGSAMSGYTATSDPDGFTSSGCTESPCTVTGLTNGTAYTFTVTATNGAGTSDPSEASNSVTPRANQTIVFDPAPIVVVDGTGVMSATGGGSPNPVVFTSTTTDTCTVSGTNGSTVTGVSVGACTIAANQAGSAAFNAAPEVTQTFAVGQGSQTISFGAAPTVVVDGTGTVSATGGNSGNPVVFSSQTTGVCTVSGTTVTGEAVGSCTIAANQAGNANYAAANEVTQTFAIGQGNQTISFGAAPTVVVDGTATVSATGGASGNPVVFSSQTTGVCTVSGTTVTGEAVGTCTIAANQAESVNYAEANEVTQSFAIGQGSQTINFAPLANKLDNDPPFSVSATGGNSAQPVTFASQTESVCTTSGSNGSTVTLTGQLGTCTVRASQAGDVNYTAATPVDQSFEVTASNQPPTIDLPATFLMLEDGSGSVSFTVGDDLTPAADLMVVATSSNVGLISDGPLADGLGGSGANRTLAFFPGANENGSAVITVTVTDGNGASAQSQLTLTVTPVNDPPSAAYGQNEVWPAGETGEKTAAGFVTLTSAGPGNESDQTVSIDLAIGSDPDGVLSAASIQPNGDLTYSLTGSSGAARITLQAVDDGGTANGGVDRGEVVTRRIIVGDGIDLTLSIRRGQPQSKHLGEALAKGATMAAYSIEVRNNSAQDADGLRLQVSPIIGLTDTLWNCVISTCTPPNGSGGIDTLVDLQAGGVLLVGLSGTVDTSVPFVEITARASLPQGVTVLLQDDDDQVFIEPSGGSGVYKSGFE